MTIRKHILKVGDQITICLFCHRQISLKVAEEEHAMGLACTPKGHIMAIATVTHAPAEQEVPSDSE